jgi:hypothetical protein
MIFPVRRKDDEMKTRGKVKRAGRVIVHSKTRLVGMPYRGITAGWGKEWLMIIYQKFETTGVPGRGWFQIEKLVRDYILEKMGDEIKQVTGKGLEELWFQVFTGESPAILAIKLKREEGEASS